MSRWMEEQQEHINTLQKELDQARRAESILREIWPEVDSQTRWADDKRHFEVSLKGTFGHVWGKHTNEHTAWLLTYNSLRDQGVLHAPALLEIVQKMDKGVER